MKSLLMASILLAAMMAGCLGTEDEAPQANSGSRARLVETLSLPEGAAQVDDGTAIHAVWANITLPFTQSLALPQGATMIRFVADPGATGAVSVAMSHDDTGRRRCNQQPVDGFSSNLQGARSCSSIAAIDPAGTNWTARATGAGKADVRIEYHYGPILGPAGNVDWSQLSHATHELNPTLGRYIEAHDGAQLWVEMTLPIGEGPWPTVIAASPYNGQTGRIPDESEGSTEQGTPAMWTYWTQDYAKRGYAAINIDVRGFGKSGGCVEVWGINEQLDQKLIVDWVADQPWSDGNVGFYGQSYVATTPVAAAVQTPEALKAIIAVAPVIDAYHDWHFGGVPNGESSLSPVAYQALVDFAGTNYAQEQIAEGDPTPTDIQNLLQYSTQGICDPTLIPLANDPRAIHGAFYDERDFGARAGDITAAVLFTEGFEDANVKSAMIPDWFNAIEAPKLGVFGHWLHQHPARMDAEAMFLGWMDEHVKGKPLGLSEAYPDAIITADGERMRGDNAWPPANLESRFLGVSFEDVSRTEHDLVEGEGSGSFDVDLTPLEDVAFVNPQTASARWEANMILDAPLALVDAEVAVEVEITGENAMLYAFLEEFGNGERRLLTWGMKNLALGDDYDTYNSLLGAGVVTDTIPLRETELIVAEGSTLRLTVMGVQAGQAVGVAQPQPSQATFYGAGTGLVFPDMPMSAYEPIALSALP